MQEQEKQNAESKKGQAADQKRHAQVVGSAHPSGHGPDDDEHQPADQAPYGQDGGAYVRIDAAVDVVAQYRAVDATHQVDDQEKDGRPQRLEHNMM